ncbi:MAG: DUF6489 family protein [Pseudomonadota bacterium]
MRISIDIDLTPQEARAFFGLPDVEPFNAMVMDELMTRAKDNIDTLADPERFVSQWVSMGGKGLEQFQTMMAAAMGGMRGDKK